MADKKSMRFARKTIESPFVVKSAARRCGQVVPPYPPPVQGSPSFLSLEVSSRPAFQPEEVQEPFSDQNLAADHVETRSGHAG